MAEPRVLVIGLDSADAPLIEQWVEEGYLPTFKSLMEEGLWSRIGTTAEVMHVSAWPSIYTGVTPGRHGMYHAYQVRAGDQLVHRTLPEWCASPPFWKMLDEAGKRCVVMDPFMGFPLEGYRGIQVLEYGTWTWFTDPQSQPANLRGEIVRRFGAYPAPEHTDQVTIPDQLRFRDQLLKAAEVKGRAARWLLSEHPWDMAFVTFGEPHGAGHYLWHSGDPDYPLYPPGGLPGVPCPLRDVYVAVDRAIGSLLELADERTTVIVTSGDGMGPNYSGSHHMPELIHKMGLFYAPTVGREDVGTAPAPKKSMTAALRGMIPLSVRQSITRCMPRSMKYKLSMKWVNADIDWERTKVFCIPNSNEGYFRINLEGREPRGNVAEGARYRELLDQLKSELGGLVNPANGRRCAHGVHIMDEVFEGPERQNLPDVVISWDETAKVMHEVEGPSAGRVTGKAPYEVPAYYTGNHRAYAFAAARGPGVSAGTGLARGHILDIAPTVLALLGVDAPAHLDGSAWPEVVTQ